MTEHDLGRALARLESAVEKADRHAQEWRATMSRQMTDIDGKVDDHATRIALLEKTGQAVEPLSSEVHANTVENAIRQALATDRERLADNARDRWRTVLQALALGVALGTAIPTIVNFVITRAEQEATP